MLLRMLVRRRESSMLSALNEKIRTVTGDISPKELGHVQCHEHIYLKKGPSYESNSALCMDDFERSLTELKEYKQAGGATIVDAQPGGFGRDARILERLSKESGVNILAVTGFHKLMFMEKDAGLAELNEEALTELFSQEIISGMREEGSAIAGLRAGLVKGAFEEGGLEHPVYSRLFRAVACTAADTGAPVLIHTEKNTDMFSLINFFEKYHVPADQLMICHLDRTCYDLDYHKEVLATGCTLCYDSVNRTKYVSHQQELHLIASMCDAGYEDQLVLSLDTTNQRLRSYYSQDMGLDYILREYVSMLVSAGITEVQIQKMCVKNAKTFLTIKI